MPQLTPAQRQYVRKHTKEVHLDPSEMGGDLNIIPFLDIVVNLIMFLLVTTLSVLAVVQIETQLPEYRRGVGGGGGPREATLNLNIIVVDEGVIVTGSGAKLAPGCTDTAPGRVITVPKRMLPIVEDGEDTGRREMRYDWEGLTNCVALVKAQFEDEEQVIVSADPTIEYQHLIAAMDAVRFKGTDELFPKVLLSGGVR